jgi:arsenite/tail-anchored protein-transporting ATPase
MSFLDGRIHLITGKGGVGRTTVAVALARAAAVARGGGRVLLTEVGEPEEGHSAVGRTFGRLDLSDNPEPVAPGIDACQLHARIGHELFARTVIPGGPLVAAALRSKALLRFMTAAPSFHELGVLYHFLRLLDLQDDRGAPRYGTVVVDMPATGHTLALTGLPETVLRVVPRGPVAEAVRRGQTLINDPRQSGAWVVTLPEQLPVTEAIELVEGLRATSVPVRGIILNRYLDDPFEADERALLEDMLGRRRLRGQLSFDRITMVRESMIRLKEATGFTPLPLREIGPEEGDPCAGLAAVLAGRAQAA